MHTAIYKPSNWLDPLDWRQVFGNDHPVEIDLGCGKGGFLVWSAQARPGRNFLGVERQVDRLRRVDKKLSRAGLTNVRLLRLEAGYFIGKLVPDHSVVAYHILFPDPWPKRRHAKNRLFQESFVAELARTLKCSRASVRRAGEFDDSRLTEPRLQHTDGVVNIATDDLDYFVQIRKVMMEKFTETKPEVLPAEAMTEFEKIFVAAGKPIGRARYVR